MKANFTSKLTTSVQALVLGVFLLGIANTVKAQAPLAGGTTYYVDGVGTDLVNPKDTFQSLSGAYAGGAPNASTGIMQYITINGTDITTIGRITIMLAPGYALANAGAGYKEPNAAGIVLGDAVNGGYPGMSPTRDIILKPFPGYNYTVTPSAVISVSFFKLNGVHSFTIDGVQKNITFQANSGLNIAKVIDIASFNLNGSHEDTIRNCNIIGSSTPTAIYSYMGIYVGGVAATNSFANSARRNQNIVVMNNYIKAVSYGIYVRGTTPAIGYDPGLIVKGNVIGGQIAPGGAQNTDFIGGSSTNYAGIYLAGQANAVVDSNVVRNTLPATGGSYRAIALTNEGGATAIDSNISITRNRIYNIVTNAAAQGSYGIRMNIGTHTQPLNITIANNTIGNVSASLGTGAVNTFIYPIGILVEDASSAVGLSILHNSVNLYGSSMNNTSYSACVVFGASTTGGVTMKNNILANRLGRAVTSLTGGTVSYAVVVNSATTSPFAAIDYNNYFVNTTDGGLAFLGYSAAIAGGNKQLVSINHWRTYTLSDNGSMTAIPPFMSDTLLDLSSSTPSILSNSGVSGTGITMDVNGNPRSLTAPSMGAVEFTCNPLNVNVPLTTGNTYQVGGVNSWPTSISPATGTFASVSDLIAYVNAYGLQGGSGSVIVELTSGYAASGREGSKYLPAFIDYPNMTILRKLVIRPAAGVTDTITVPNQNSFNYCSVFRFIGAKYITIDGNVSRSLTLLMPASAANVTGTRVVAITPSDQSPTTDITIQNCIITGNSTPAAINTNFGIYLGHYQPTGANMGGALISGNNNLNFTGNLIQAVRTGIYLRGPNLGGGQSFNCVILNNTIGGTNPSGGATPTTYIGGTTTPSVNPLAGIYLKGVANSFVDGNTIRNTTSITPTTNDFHGIELDAISSTELGNDSNITIRNNKIYNLTTTSNSCAGIRINFGADTIRKFVLYNNFIGKIQGIGANSSFSNLNPAGILIEGSVSIANVGIEMYYNTIQLSGKTLTNNSVSACLYMSNNIRSGITMRDNLFVNMLGNTNPALGKGYVIQTGAGSNPFLYSYGSVNNNVYYAGGANGAGNFVGYAVGVDYPSLGNWRGYNLQDSNSYTHKVLFVTDTMPDVQLPTAGPVVYGGVILPITNADIYSNFRFGSPGYNRVPAGTNPCVGAVEFGQPYSPFVGGATYYINGVQNPPLKGIPGSYSFATVNRAFHYLISNGVDNNIAPANPISVIITSGYAGEGDTLIMPLTEFPNMNANRIVTLKTDSVRTITTTGGANGTYGNNSSVIRFSGGSYFAIDGSINGTHSKDLTIMPPAVTSGNTTLRVIDFVPGNIPSTNITIMNCNILGSSTTAGTVTYAGIYSGGITATPVNPVFSGTNNNKFLYNFIGGVRYGVYLRGAAATRGQQDVGNIIRGNMIGGDVNVGGPAITNYFGGSDASAGIFLSSQTGSVIDSNTIRNNIRTTNNNLVRGIELSNASGALSMDSNILISRNNIYNLRTGAAAVYGIYVFLGSDSLKRITIENNWISGISSAGTFATTNPVISTSNPAGILVDGTPGFSINNLGINIWYNSINLGPASAISTPVYGLTASSSASSCIQFGTPIKGGVVMKNNILQNRLPVTASATSSRAFSVVVGANQNIFASSNNNDYFPNATGAVAVTNVLMGYNAGGAALTTLNTLPAIATYTTQDTSSISFVTSQFISDTVLDIPGLTPSVLAGSASYINSVPQDMLGHFRPTFGPTIGAVEFGGTSVDSVAPKVYNYTQMTCGTGPFIIDLAAYTKTVTADTLYYMVYGNPTVYKVTSPTILGNHRFYTISTGITANSLILFKDTIWGALGTKGYEPANGWDSIATTVTSYPYGYGFDGPNLSNWTVQSIVGNGAWQIGSYGSVSNPNFPTAFSGVKTAMLPSSGASPFGSRLVSPCFDLSTGVQLPTLRFWMSQNPDLPTKRDSIIVKLNAGGGWFAPGPNTVVVRPNSNLLFPGWKQVDICLSSFVGTPGIRVGIEGYAVGAGNNILIDSIMMIDNVVNSPITPKVNTICAYDSIALNIGNSQAGLSYTMYDFFTNAQLSASYIGNGGNLTIKAVNPNIDSVWIKILAVNILDPTGGCFNFMADTAKVYIQRFKNGPFLTAGSPFGGAYNPLNASKFGVPVNVDGGKIGDTLTYTLVPPSGLTNSDYGTKWSVTSQSIKTVVNIPANSATFTAPTPLTSGKYVMIVKTADGDSVFYLSMNFRLTRNGTNCDSTVIRAIKITSAPVVTVSNGGRDSACKGAATNFLFTATPNPLTSPYTYAWDFGDGTTSTNSGFTKVYGAAGTYTVKLVVTNNASLSTTLTKQFVVLPSPTSGFTNSKPCTGDSIIFTNTSTGAATYKWDYTSQWAFGSSTAANPHLYFTTPGNDTGTYMVQLVATNTLGCMDTTTHPVQLFAKPTASFTITNHCLGTIATITNNSSIPGASNSFGSVWDPGTGDTVFLSNNPVYYFSKNGTFTLKLKVTSNYGCVDSTSQLVTIYDKPRSLFTVDTTTTCQFSNVSLTNGTTYSGGSNKVLYLWKFGDNTLPSTDAVPVKSYGVTGPYTITLISTDTVHYCTDSVMHDVNIGTTPVAQFDAPTGGCVKDTVFLTNKTFSVASDSVKFYWTFGDGANSTVTSPGHPYTTFGTDTIKLVATAKSGCTSALAKIINISPSPVVTMHFDALDLYNVRIVASSNAFSTYKWAFDDGTPLQTAYRDTFPMKSYSNYSGYHKVTLTVSDINGCKGSVTDSAWTRAVGIQNALANQYGIDVYPNPFTDATSIYYTLQNTSKVSVKVFDMLGRMVVDIDNGNEAAGEHAVVLDADKFSGKSAAYIVRIQIDDNIITRQIVRQK